MKFEIIDRAAALAANRKRYYTGKPCKYGHDAQRFVTTGGCVACNAVRSAEFRTGSTGAAGRFLYPLHPDDFAAAMAYCQGLDLARGRVPYVPPTPRGAETLVLPDHIARRRAELLAAHQPPAPEAPYLPGEMRTT